MGIVGKKWDKNYKYGLIVICGIGPDLADTSYSIDDIVRYTIKTSSVKVHSVSTQQSMEALFNNLSVHLIKGAILLIPEDKKDDPLAIIYRKMLAEHQIRYEEVQLYQPWADRVNLVKSFCFNN